MFSIQNNVITLPLDECVFINEELEDAVRSSLYFLRCIEGLV